MSTRAGLLIIIVLLVAIAGATALSGCGSTFTGVCAVKPIGKDEHGNAYVFAHCEPAD